MKQKFKLNSKPYHIELAKHVKVLGCFVDGKQNIYEFTGSDGTLWWAGEEELVTHKTRQKNTRIFKLLEAEKTVNSEETGNCTDLEKLTVRGAYLGKGDDGCERYAVNQYSLDPPPPIKEPKPRKEKPFTRTTIATATKDQIRNAYHKALIGK